MENALLINSISLIGAFLLMEGVAWFAHKYIMHGFLWKWHKDHHKPTPNTFFEKNDYFFLVFATPGILSMLIGLNTNLTFLLFIGLGITLYGFTYFMIHDIFIHRRFKWFRKSNWRYLDAIQRAHKIHHKHLGQENGECFGLLWFPTKYFNR